MTPWNAWDEWNEWDEWDEHVAAALLGTERRDPPGLDGAPGGDDAAARLLDQAALLTVRRRAGAAAARAEDLEMIAPAPLDGDPAVPAAAAARLARILSGEQIRVLPEWLDAAAARGLRVPARLLPALLERGRSDRMLRPSIARAAGRRGMWLALQNTDWAYLVGSGLARSGDDPAGAEAWRSGTRHRRAAYLSGLRGTDPAAARELLRDAWDREPAPDRAAFLGTFARGLSLADEEFLEAALEDRGKDVRQLAADLLARLPGAAYGERMATRARACVTARTDPGTVRGPDAPGRGRAGARTDAGTRGGAETPADAETRTGAGARTDAETPGGAETPADAETRTGAGARTDAETPGGAETPADAETRTGAGARTDAETPGGAETQTGAENPAGAGARGVRIVVEAPREHDAGLARDGVPFHPGGSFAPRADGGPVGTRAAWLREILARTPLSAWTSLPSLSGLPPAEIVLLPVPDGGARDLHIGWARAALNQRDVPWARALLGGGVVVDEPEALADLLGVLPEDERDASAAGLVRWVRDRAELLRMLERVPGPWTGPLSAAVVAIITGSAGRPTRAAEHTLTQLCRVADLRLAPACASRLAEHPVRPFPRPLADLIDTLRFRDEMLKELS